MVVIVVDGVIAAMIDVHRPRNALVTAGHRLLIVMVARMHRRFVVALGRFVTCNRRLVLVGVMAVFLVVV
jgi:hypothetical protein